jgi:alkanesulfonate monooxygenase SsuD/methylene tetrahydromethanopterin reductase-like flavin-dependent oxidoreductase (luciferase family)
MRFFMFHLMPWDRLPASYEGPAWVTCSNSHYDPVHGGELYNRYVDELIRAEALGFDGVCVNEHHANAYGNMPSPNLIASILARQTSRLKIAVVGNALPLYNPPIRVAEEFAMIDCISGGRLVAGMVVGGGPEYYSNGLNPAEARGRFNEAVDLIIRCWTEPGPFQWNGRYYKLRYVNPWPVPIQKPHPPIWIPGAGSLETMEYVARRRWAYMGIPYFHKRVFKKNFDFFREACEKEGYTASPEQMGWLVPVYVAESDEQARREYEPHLWHFAKKLLPGINVSPPGYISARSALKVRGAFNDFLLNVSTWEQIEDGDYAIVGSAATVREKMAELIRWMGVGNVLVLPQLATLPADLTQKNQELFAHEVMPSLRTLDAPGAGAEAPGVERPGGGAPAAAHTV